jgi:hypothetical protein
MPVKVTIKNALERMHRSSRLASSFDPSGFRRSGETWFMGRAVVRMNMPNGVI